MVDRAVPNLPSRDLQATSTFYGAFGFAELHRDENWLVLRRGDVQLEFFFKQDLEPRGHDFALCALRISKNCDSIVNSRCAGDSACTTTERPLDHAGP
jgi:catechol 2,3-dioxygenase-like lactoylglutathione lyase family enzyme